MSLPDEDRVLVTREVRQTPRPDRGEPQLEAEPVAVAMKRDPFGHAKLPGDPVEAAQAPPEIARLGKRELVEAAIAGEARFLAQPPGKSFEGAHPARIHRGSPSYHGVRPTLTCDRDVKNRQYERSQTPRARSAFDPSTNPR